MWKFQDELASNQGGQRLKKRKENRISVMSLVMTEHYILKYQVFQSRKRGFEENVIVEQMPIQG